MRMNCSRLPNQGKWTAAGPFDGPSWVEWGSGLTWAGRHTHSPSTADPPRPSLTSAGTTSGPHPSTSPSPGPHSISPHPPPTLLCPASAFPPLHQHSVIPTCQCLKSRAERARKWTNGYVRGSDKDRAQPIPCGLDTLTSTAERESEQYPIPQSCPCFLCAPIWRRLGFPAISSCERPTSSLRSFRSRRR